MKKLLLTLIVYILFQNAFACEICGCSSGNYFIGPYPQFNRHFIGLRYSYRSFKSVMNSDNTQYSNDFYQTAELLVGTNIGYRWQILLFAPFNFNYSKSDDGEKRLNGIGDLSLIGNYKLFDNKSLNSDTETVSQQWWIGGGLKFPTGKFAVDPGELVTSANSQPGTGSLDFIINSSYIIQIGSWGISSNVNYKINNSAHKFRFGNRFSANSFIFRTLRSGKTTLSPNVGILYEYLNVNTNDGIKVEGTGGNALMAAIGLEAQKNNIIMGINAQLPLYSYISSGQTHARSRGMVHISYIL